MCTARHSTWTFLEGDKSLPFSPFTLSLSLSLYITLRGTRSAALPPLLLCRVPYTTGHHSFLSGKAREQEQGWGEGREETLGMDRSRDAGADAVYNPLAVARTVLYQIPCINI